MKTINHSRGPENGCLAAANNIPRMRLCVRVCARVCVCMCVACAGQKHQRDVLRVTVLGRFRRT